MKRQAPHQTEVKVPEPSTKSQKNPRKKVGLDESCRDGSIAERNLHMLNSESMADCTFVVGAVKKKKLLSHKSILSHASAVFHAMFNGELQEKGDVRVDDIEPQPFRKMLEYIYSDNTVLENVETALSICYAANKYLINKLILKCIHFIKENLNENTVCKALEFARLIDNADLEAESLKYLSTNTSDVLKSASFPHAEKATLITILNHDRLFITSEMKLFLACIRWAEAQQRGDNISLREVLGPEVLNLIRFLTMTVQDFVTFVVPSNLLQLQQEHDILCRFATGTGNMPQGFTTNMGSRKAFGPREIIKFEGSNYFLCLNNTKNSLSLSVNVESYIFGVKLYGFHSYSQNTVEDSFEIQLLLNSELVSSTKFEIEVTTGTPIDANFSEPFLLKPDTEYTLQVTFTNSNTNYGKRRYGDKTYTTTAGVEMTVKFFNTTISQIYIAKKFN